MAAAYVSSSSRVTGNPASSSPASAFSSRKRASWSRGSTSQPSSSSSSSARGWESCSGSWVPSAWWAAPRKSWADSGGSSSWPSTAAALANRRARKVPGAVGIWHETYAVDRAESMYVGMPVTGLAAATGSREAAAGSRAAQRLGQPRTAA
ncbi:DUF4188 domain-containing protein [Arthrobacter sp. BL-252-APC-1A]|uniref:monooxygenase family protein n=1 Tax=Arthrobacter sp. BL-252-APC-1A TaxID=2606622 RepID=UPI0012B23F2C|nr:DUF4188 domain-containing protein [Arthrobacter sp. BL-252-APC-1A]MSS00345.1 DUF4188 domain-containing protein [Arthrobacter sp. BL-252-APC-1A]